MDRYISDGTFSILSTLVLTAGIIFGLNSCVGNGKVDSTLGAIFLVSILLVGFWYYVIPYIYTTVESTIG